MINATPKRLYPRERDRVPIVQKAGWAPEPVWTGTEILAFTAIRTPDLFVNFHYRISSNLLLTSCFWYKFPPLCSQTPSVSVLLLG
jgi:hypothetical protein